MSRGHHSQTGAMGELVAGKPALRIETAVSLPLDLVSVLSLLFRAVPGSGLDPWLLAARAQLSGESRDTLDLLHGFSGRLLYYPEEPVMRFEPLRPDRRSASFSDLIAFMRDIPAPDFVDMVQHALRRVYNDREMRWRAPEDDESLRQALVPALTTANIDDVMALVTNPDELKRRTVALYADVWDSLYRDARAQEEPLLHAAASRGAALIDRSFAEAYAALTGQRLPDVLDRPPSSISRVAFCPSVHLGEFVSYIAYGPDLIVFYAAPQFLARTAESHGSRPAETARDSEASDFRSTPDLLDAVRALGDPTRLRMLDVLLDGELYAQEIVGRIGVAQSAVSRHLAHLERAGIVTVEQRRGSKYYAVNSERLDGIAAALASRAEHARGRRPSRCLQSHVA